jgi:hypothetical protein
MVFSRKSLATGRAIRFSKRSFTMVRNISLYKDMDGNLSGRMMRYEDLSKDFARLVTDLGVTVPPSLPHAKRGMMSNHLNPLEYLSRDQIEMVNTEFAEEFEMFGYQKL